jgi:hypothetical protein
MKRLQLYPRPRQHLETAPPSNRRRLSFTIPMIPSWHSPPAFAQYFSRAVMIRPFRFPVRRPLIWESLECLIQPEKLLSADRRAMPSWIVLDSREVVVFLFV